MRDQDFAITPDITEALAEWQDHSPVREVSNGRLKAFKRQAIRSYQLLYGRRPTAEEIAEEIAIAIECY